MLDTMTDTWHITIPLLLHSCHVAAGSLIRVSRQWDAIVHETFPDLGPFNQLVYVCSIVQRLMTTRFVNLFDRIVTLPESEITEILVASSSECYWSLVASLADDGRLWRYLDAEWRMSASKHHTHALAMVSVINQPIWTRALLSQLDSGILTRAQFTDIRTAMHNSLLRKLDIITEYHSASGPLGIGQFESLGPLDALGQFDTLGHLDMLEQSNTLGQLDTLEQ
jgi:hypothetical protein